MINPQLMQNIAQVFSHLEIMETTVSGLYEMAARQWPADAALWDDMSKEEIKHAEYIKLLAAIVAKNPDNFVIGRPINITSINSSVTWINKNIADIKNGSLDKNKMHFLARDIEQSILEAKYAEFLKTDNQEYNKLIKLVFEETISHRKKIDDKISSLKKG